MESRTTFRVSAGEEMRDLPPAFEVGGHVQIWGRIQSREYVKKLDDDDDGKKGGVRSIGEQAGICRLTVQSSRYPLLQSCCMCSKIAIRKPEHCRLFIGSEYTVRGETCSRRYIHIFCGVGHGQRRQRRSEKASGQASGGKSVVVIQFSERRSRHVRWEEFFKQSGAGDPAVPI